MKICVFGAGATGGLVAVRLAQVSGLAISVVARGAQLAAMREHGLRLHSPAGELQARVQATNRPRNWAARTWCSSRSSSIRYRRPSPGWPR